VADWRAPHPTSSAVYTAVGSSGWTERNLSQPSVAARQGLRNLSHLPSSRQAIVDGCRVTLSLAWQSSWGRMATSDGRLQPFDNFWILGAQLGTASLILTDLRSWPETLWRAKLTQAGWWRDWRWLRNLNEYYDLTCPARLAKQVW